nr:hypothetical protein [Mycoplasmopsis bovis]
MKRRWKKGRRRKTEKKSQKHQKKVQAEKETTTRYRAEQGQGTS